MIETFEFRTTTRSLCNNHYFNLNIPKRNKVNFGTKKIKFCWENRKPWCFLKTDTIFEQLND